MNSLESSSRSRVRGWPRTGEAPEAKGFSKATEGLKTENQT